MSDNRNTWCTEMCGKHTYRIGDFGMSSFKPEYMKRILVKVANDMWNKDDNRCQFVVSTPRSTLTCDGSVNVHITSDKCANRLLGVDPSRIDGKYTYAMTNETVLKHMTASWNRCRTSIYYVCTEMGMEINSNMVLFTDGSMDTVPHTCKDENEMISAIMNMDTRLIERKDVEMFKKVWIDKYGEGIVSDIRTMIADGTIIVDRDV